MSQITNYTGGGSGGGAVFSIAGDVGIATPLAGIITLAGGSNVTTTAAGSTVTIDVTGSVTLTYTFVNMSPYVVLITDQYISVDSSGGPITIELPNAATAGKTFIIKDQAGSAATNNITVTTVGGTVLLDGATSFIMNTNYQSIQVMGSGTAYEIF